MKNSGLTPTPAKATPASPKEDSRRVGILQVVRGAEEEGKWEVWRRDSGAFTITTVDHPRIRRQDFARTVFCWPCRDAITLPIWVAADGLAEEMVALDLELRGLARPGEVPPFVFDEVLREKERRLLAVHLLRDNAARCPVLEAGWHDIGARWLPAAKDALHFWREEGSIVYALSRQNQIVYSESLRTTELTDSDFKSIRRVILRLQAEGVLVGQLSFVVAFNFPTPFPADAAQRILGIPCRSEEHRPPILPSVPQDLPSAEILAWRKQKDRRRKLQLLVLCFLAVILIAGGIAGLGLGREIIELRQLKADLAAQADEVDRLIGIARDWHVVEAAVDSTYYPLDLLRDCAAQLPEKGTRFTSFSINGPEIVIQGEAVNHPAAFELADKIKKSPALAQYTWEVPQPTLLPNNTASFQMRGTRKSNETTRP